MNLVNPLNPVNRVNPLNLVNRVNPVNLVNRVKPVNLVNRRRFACLYLFSALVACFSVRVTAHDIPADTTVRAFIKPEGDRLRFLVRVPMASIHDIDWPMHKPEGTLDLARVESALGDAVGLWIIDYVDMYEGSTKIGPPTLTSVRLSLEDNAFATYDDALATLTGPKIPDDTKLLPSQGMLDALLDYPIQSAPSRFSFHPRFDRFGLRVRTILRFLPPNRAVRAFEYDEGDPGIVTLDPQWYQAAWNFATLGFRHILDGADHLLFLLCLIIPLRRFRALIPVVTAFTVAHSMTLIAATYDMVPGALWFPPLIDTLIAVSIVYMAIENIVVANPGRRWLMAFAFGLVHGFAFSFALGRTLQFAGSHLLASLLSFNLGVEVGQIVMLALMVPALVLLFRIVPERAGTIVLSGLAAHTAWHWMLDRYGQLARYRFEWPALDAAFLASAMRWLMLIVAVAFVLWLIRVLRPRAKEASS